jgi:hypothetical protein
MVDKTLILRYITTPITEVVVHATQIRGIELPIIIQFQKSIYARFLLNDVIEHNKVML